MGEQSESSGEANFVTEFLLKIPEMVCIKVFLFPEFPLSLGFCGEFGNEVSSEDTIPSNFSMSLSADEDFFISVFLEFRATGIPNLAGSVNGVAGKDIGGSVAALVRGGAIGVTLGLLGSGIDEDGIATRVLLVLGLLALALKIIS